jgi:peptidyl-prolyl cis-trans isomerase SurA
MRLARRRLVAGLLLAVALGGVTGCRTDPNVAAYVGDNQITEAQLDTAVQQRLEDKAIAAYAKAQGADFTRRVLSLLVDAQVYTAVAERYSVTVSDADVRARIEQLLAGQDAQAAYDQAAQQGYSRADVFENVREQLVRQQVAKAKGLADDLSVASLRAAYEKEKESLLRTQLGYITVPDQATADAIVAQLNANPRAYAQFAARFPGNTTLPAPQARTADQIPPQLADAVAAAKPNTAFAVPVQEVGGVVVGFVGGRSYPTFEEVRPDLENKAASTVDAAATKIIETVRGDLDITVNPRYGVFENGVIKAETGGVVQILGGSAASASPAGN